MIRKSLFWGLTLVLVVALVSLILRGRKIEKQQASRAVSVTQESKSTPIKVLSPRELEIVDSTVQQNSRQAPGSAFGIRNNGAVPYSRIDVEFIFLDGRGRVTEKKRHLIDQTVMPGAEIKIVKEALPASAAELKILILSAEIGSEYSPDQR